VNCIKNPKNIIKKNSNNIMNFEEKEKTLSTGICRFVKKITENLKIKNYHNTN